MPIMEKGQPRRGRLDARPLARVHGPRRLCCRSLRPHVANDRTVTLTEALMPPAAEAFAFGELFLAFPDGENGASRRWSLRMLVQTQRLHIVGISCIIVQVCLDHCRAVT